MVNRLIATGLLAVLSLAWLVACGTSGAGNLSNPSREESRGGTGVWAGGYEVIRYNAAGFPDPTLNGTLTLALDEQGGQTALVINVSDNNMTGMVALDVRYDSGRVHPADVEFHGSMGDDSQVLSASFLSQIPGVASVGQVGIHDYKPARLDGQFATVRFESGGLRAVSAPDGVHTNEAGVGDIIGDHAQNPLADTPNMTAESDTVAGTARLSWSAAWHLADGNQNGIVEIADLSPIGKYLNDSVTANWPAVTADYDGNGIVTVAELSTMGKYLSEGTTTYLVEVGDDGATSGFTTVGNFDWTLTEGDDWAAPSDPNNPAVPDPVNLGTVFKTWTVDFDATTAFTFQQLNDVDLAGNANGAVTLHVTPQRAGENGVTSSADIGVFVDTTRYITVSGVDIQVVGATGGTGDGSFFDVDNDAGSVVANSNITIMVNGISGTYSSLAGGGQFSAGNLPADMTPVDYADALAAIRARVTWVVANGGAAGFRYRSDWVTFNPPPPAQGDLGPGTVFPDDDPESTGASAEGLLTLDLAAAADLDGDDERSIVASNFTHDFTFDVTADPSAPIMGDPFDLRLGQTATELRLLEGTEVQIDLTVATPIADATQTTLQILEIGPGGNVLDTIEFLYVPGATNQGEFFFRTVDPANMQAFVSGVAINPASAYHFTWQDAGGPWSSLNTPEPVLTTVPPPPPADLQTVPSRLNFPDQVQFRIMHPEPEIRRGTNAKIDASTGNLFFDTPEDEVAFNDVLKIEGDNFLTTAKDGQIFPRVTIIADTGQPNFGPDLIDATTPTVPGMLYAGDPQPGWITIDLLGYDPWPQSGEQRFAYKVFNVNDTAAGQGEFLMQSIGISEPAPFAVNWGVNVFDRGNTPTAVIADLPALYGNRTINQANVGTATPDILWFQFSGGYMFDFNPMDGDSNVKAVFEWGEENGGDFSSDSANLDLRVAGVAPNGDYLAIHPVVFEDFFPNGGNFLSGNSYVVHLWDPSHPGEWQATYGDGNDGSFDGDPFNLSVINNP